MQGIFILAFFLGLFYRSATLYHPQARAALKGQCHEIFDLWFFSSNNPI
jgi:hypothetical protein